MTHPIQLTCANLAQLNEGHAGRTIDEALAEVCQDLDQRGGDGETRVVKIEVRLKQEKDTEQVKITVRAGTKRPGWKTSEHVAKIRKLKGKAVIVFRPDNETDPDQGTLFNPEA